MALTLPPDLEATVRERVSSGAYSSSSEVLREALRLIDARDRWLEAQREAFRRDVEAGLAQLDRGERESVTAADIMGRIDRRLASDR
jgi:antitoxin ParD1/3/4